MAGQRRTPRFVDDEARLERARLEAKRDDCPHCERADTLVGQCCTAMPCGAGTIVRGRRLLCSNRHRRPGCGRTVAVLLATVIAGCVVSTRVVSTLVEAVVRGDAPRSMYTARKSSPPVCDRSSLCARPHVSLRDRVGFLDFCEPATAGARPPPGRRPTATPGRARLVVLVRAYHG
jgi:hypothetical protein